MTGDDSLKLPCLPYKVISHVSEMSVPVLSKKQQKKSLSGIKNRKKVQKNILAAPGIIKIRQPVWDVTYSPRITETLKDLLPNARLPHAGLSEKCKSVNSSEKSDKTSVDASLKRNQLFLGINSVSRGVSNESVACILFANDIKPKLLISHLVVLCSLKNIPYLYVENLRTVTKMTLGFSCIALGVKKNSTFFLPLITLVVLATESPNETNENKINDSISEKPSNSMAISAEIDTAKKSETCGKPENTFTYLLRNSDTKRVFVPDSVDADDLDRNFISFGAEDEVNTSFSKTFRKGISEEKTFTLSKGAPVQNQKNPVDEKGNSDFPVYSPTQIIKMGTNLNRERKKFVKLKKKKKLVLAEEN